MSSSENHATGGPSNEADLAQVVHTAVLLNSSDDHTGFQRTYSRRTNSGSLGKPAVVN